MATVTAGSSATETMSSRSTITISSIDGTERANIVVLRAGAQVFGDRVSNGASVGPFEAGDVLLISAEGGSIDYTVTAFLSPVSGGGPITSGVWMTPQSIFRLRMTGTGTATVDARDKLGAITLGIATYTASGATNQIEYPYLGDAASDMRVTLTGTATAEVM